MPDSPDNPERNRDPNDSNPSQPPANDDSAPQLTNDPTSQSATPSSTSSSEARRETGIFDRFMDAILNRRPPSARDTTTSSTPNNPEPASSIPANPPAGSDSADSGDSNLFSDFYGGSAIMITVNYVFSDENDPTNPNSTGSLVISLPNNAQNRDLSTIQEFVRLATQMAYSTISGMHKKRGITLDKFNSFPIKKVSEVEHIHDCSICLEEFENLPSVAKSPVDIDDGPAKKRKLNDASPVPSLSSTSASTPTETQTPLAAPPLMVPPARPTPQRVKYLSEFTGEFVHVPVQMPCGHVFGKSCLFEWLKNHSNCPLCRQSCADEPATSNSNSNTTTIDLTNPNLNTYSDGNSRNNELLEALANRLDRQSSADTDSRPPYVFQRSEIPLRRVLRSGNGVQEGANTPNSDTPTTNRRIPHYHLIDPSRFRDIFSRPATPGRSLFTPQQNEPLFPSYVASRRTENGVETVTSENNIEPESRASNEENTLDYLNLGSLLDDNLNSTTSSDSNSNPNDVNDNDSNNREN